MHKDTYENIIGAARLAIFDGIVAGKPFAEMVRDVVQRAIEEGHVAGRNIDEGEIKVVDLRETTTPIELTDSWKEDDRRFMARVTTDALGVMFKGDMEGVATMLTNSGIVFGFDQKRWTLADREAERMLAEMAQIAKETGDRMVDDERATAFFTRIAELSLETMTVYMGRFVREESLKATASNAAYIKAIRRYRDIAILG